MKPASRTWKSSTSSRLRSCSKSTRSRNRKCKGTSSERLQRLRSAVELHPGGKLTQRIAGALIIKAPVSFPAPNAGSWREAIRSAGIGKLIVQHNVQQRAVHLQRAFRPARVVNEAQLPESVHEEADPGTSGPYHLSQGLLTDLGDDSFRDAFFAEVGEQ